ncbi:MAG: hypothetical protein ISS70_19100 [Phycisphaerae bacterium]|nr:hypothetical protein [Phycisphaerae bacterium]
MAGGLTAGKNVGKSAGEVADATANARKVPGHPNRGHGGRGGDLHHAKTQQHVTDTVGGRQEVRIYESGPGSDYRVVDNLDAKNRIHQVGEMRTRGGYRPSSRERGAIEDVRKVVGDEVDIIYHDKMGKNPSLINPDKQSGWKPASPRHRKFKR